MGYTLVAVFPEECENNPKEICRRIGAEKANKIPYGSGFDRAAANRNLPYHMTLVHWRQKESLYNENAKSLHFNPCKIKVDRFVVPRYANGSSGLLLMASTDEGFIQLKDHIEQNIGLDVSDKLHITIAIDYDTLLIKELAEQVKEKVCFPFVLPIEAMELYHIWEPVLLEKRYE